MKLRLAQTTTALNVKHWKVRSIIQANAVMFPPGVFGLRDSFFIENVFSVSGCSMYCNLYEWDAARTVGQ